MNECGFCRGWTVKNGIKVCLKDRWWIYRWDWKLVRGYPVTVHGNIKLHMLICPNHEAVHHINGDKMDARRCNLIGLTHSEHAKLHHKTNYKTKKYPGATFNKNKNPEKKCWQSVIMLNGKSKRLGLFEDPITASIVYKLIKEEVNAI